jgi:hypothetical protein
MTPFNPVRNVIPKVRVGATKHAIRLTEKTIEKTLKANSFLTELANFFLFLTDDYRNFFQGI